MHTVMPLGDRPYLVVTSEGERPCYFCNEATDGLFKKIESQPMNIIGMVEMSDPENLSLITPGRAKKAEELLRNYLQSKCENAAFDGKPLN